MSNGVYQIHIGYPREYSILAAYELLLSIVENVISHCDTIVMITKSPFPSQEQEQYR